MSASRLAAIAAAFCCALVVLVVLRGRTTEESPVTKPAAPRAARDALDDIAAGTRRPARERQASNRSAGRPGAPPPPPARADADYEPKAATGGSTRSSTPGIGAVDQTAAARRREEAVQHLLEPQARNPGSARTAEDLLLNEGFPPGTRFAARLSGSTTAADGSEPIVEKNTEHDGNDGIYFPPDAQLAYPHRAGVQDDAGTVALWIEPVDWDGRDASVHSFFRLNDSSDGSYRFHLLKDSANLRFQFITDQGENDVRVPIDWWPRGEGHHVAATWDDNVLRVYVDGAVVGEQPYTGTLKVGANVPGWWGSNAESGTPGAGAVLKQTFVSGRPLEESEIQTLSQNE